MYGKELRSAVMLIAAAVFVAFCVSASSGIAKKDTTKRQTVIIDAGHGGFDGGATAPDGTTEKDINLAVSLKLKKILTLYGYDVITLRDTDTALNTEGDTTRSKKRSDIMNRYAVMEANPDSIYLCIHQNNFSASYCHGAQMFYCKSTDGSKELAECIQTSLKAVQPDNDRVIKPCTDDVYLIYNAKTTALLVECGFLSNRDDLLNLKNEEYQMKLAFAISSGLNNYMNGS
ncbi:MAG: N-acetylmuramoyl-L-alanine amidase [Clostridia bacterium]|nr:N-acetylmuramoyl-L-alanine amidase [Clostridia bacterium]MBQ2318621.1 N-acetylmuramoyl-L-alanine amidase [Clostridia bacterium]